MKLITNVKFGHQHVGGTVRLHKPVRTPRRIGAQGLRLLAMICLVIVGMTIGYALDSYFHPDQRVAAEKVCGAEGGHCQW